jgi:hypothetical protein
MGRLQTCRVLGIDLLNSSSSSEDIANEGDTLLTPMLLVAVDVAWCAPLFVWVWAGCFSKVEVCVTSCCMLHLLQHRETTSLGTCRVDAKACAKTMRILQNGSEHEACVRSYVSCLP